MNERRRFLMFLSASPLLAAAGIKTAAFERLARSPRGEAHALGLVQQVAQDAPLIGSPAEALDVLDFEPVARTKIPPAHWGYLATGTDDDATIRANREGYSRYELRVRRLVDVSRIDTSVEMLGTTWPTPIVINPVGSQRAFHPQGELAVARAAKAKGHLQVVSTVTTTSVEDVIAARGGPVWFQLYHQSDWNQTRAMVKRVEAAGCPAIVFTVDLIGGSNRETMFRERLHDTRVCIDCHPGGGPAPGVSGRLDDRDNARKPMLNTRAPGTPIPEAGTPTWEFVDRLRNATSMKVFIKGIVTREDAELAIQHGCAGMFVSNHGGRAENSLRPTIACLPEVAAAVNGRGVVIVDGGVRRGTDIFKAMALGATSVGIGRPYIWGLGASGQEGVETVLAILRKELEMTMRQAGTISVKRITKDFIVGRS